MQCCMQVLAMRSAWAHGTACTDPLHVSIVSTTCSRAKHINKQLGFFGSSHQEAFIPHDVLLPLLIEDTSDAAAAGARALRGNRLAACQVPGSQQVLVLSSCGQIGEWTGCTEHGSWPCSLFKHCPQNGQYSRHWPVQPALRRCGTLVVHPDTSHSHTVACIACNAAACNVLLQSTPDVHIGLQCCMRQHHTDTARYPTTT